jgi:GH35 family endo-1,4-beta-xylanase
VKTALAFVDWLKSNHAGKDNAIHACDMKHWGSRRIIRLMVHDLRRNGHPICSGQEGYYYADNSREVAQTLSFLDSIQDDLSKVITEMNVTFDNMRIDEMTRTE